jgi:molybdate transport system substrate-binding protein
MMSRRVGGLRLATLVAVAGLAAGCSEPGALSSSIAPSPASATPAAEGPEAFALSVFGAASLKDVLATVKTAYEAAVPDITITVATDSSSTLRTQIEQGAPADVFLSADQANPSKLADAGLTDGDAVDFASNRLTVILPSDDPADISSPADLAGPGVKIIAASEAVPITKYAQVVVANLAALPGYPANFAEAYAANVVSNEQNVKAVVAKIELGEGDAAIVYVTDAMASSTVKSIEIPPGANVPASYSGVVIKASARAAQAHAFLDWLAGPDGAAILATFGFLPPS